MQIAILSDIHDRLDHLVGVLARPELQKCGRLFFLGDFCAPFTLAALAEGFDRPIDAILGNNDGDPLLLSQIASQHSHVTLHGPHAELEVAGQQMALHHYPEIARRLAQSGAYDAVFSGHDHQKYQHQMSGCLWANPGEVMGRFGPPSFGVYQSSIKHFAHFEL